ncbi:UDP-2,3-diacylglucosamine diphosphatase [Thiomicrorhabdus indica]|uniref:UDP-2,3-diacylglucosamine diphosphatase n=1 Tax=Thiomicrorhabdus indica TaxID=2267253 RepID=UPI0013EE9917|nr:UDP-2,3-diacylglucosamine diphosphatase [Thiomicrorhabdus indica]
MTASHSQPKTLALVIADIHLQPNNPKHPINQHFLSFIQKVAPSSSKLYILGDLFEVWLGDDIGLQDYATELNALKYLIDSGTQVFVQYGNRDFLMKQRFSQTTGIQLLPDEYPAEIGPHKLLMVHGDQLCTLDENYQKMRRWFRKNWVQWLFLKLPQTQRKKIGSKMRQTSNSTGRSKSSEMMDAQESAIVALLNRYPDYHTLIHGHTHQPNHYEFTMNQHSYHRYVLSDWRPQTNYLSIDSQKIQIINFE